MYPPNQMSVCETVFQGQPSLPRLFVQVRSLDASTPEDATEGVLLHPNATHWWDVDWSCNFDDCRAWDTGPDPLPIFERHWTTIEIGAPARNAPYTVGAVTYAAANLAVDVYCDGQMVETFQQNLTPPPGGGLVWRVADVRMEEQGCQVTPMAAPAFISIREAADRR